jgi:hypothetical protein
MLIRDTVFYIESHWKGEEHVEGNREETGKTEVIRGKMRHNETKLCLKGRVSIV